jgi:hypothetical protein
MDFVIGHVAFSWRGKPFQGKGGDAFRPSCGIESRFPRAVDRSDCGKPAAP